MKKAAVFIPIIFLLFSSCKKNERAGNPDHVLIENAKSFFNQTYNNSEQATFQTNGVGNHSNPRLSGSKVVLWNKASIFRLGKSPIVIAPVQYTNNFQIQSNFGGKAVYAINDLVKLCIYADNTGILHSVMVSFFPDSNYTTTHPFTGIAFVDDFRGNPITKYQFQNGGAVLKCDADSILPQESGVESESTKAETADITETCYTISGYNYVEGNPEETYAWSESAGCTYSADESFASVGNGGISGAGIGMIGGLGAYTAGGEVIIPGGDNVIGSIVDYDGCFTQLGADNIYQVTVCVSQPNQGTRTPWGISSMGVEGSSSGANPVNVGHAFLIFSEVSGSNIIKRNVGFYPQSDVDPYHPSAKGELNDDDQKGYNISLTTTLTNVQFFNMLDYLAQNSDDPYNLNTLNCATFALKILSAGDVLLPSTIGQWFNGSGNDPGDLGEDIRSMNLSPNMTRNSVSSSHPNLGTCN